MVKLEGAKMRNDRLRVVRTSAVLTALVTVLATGCSSGGSSAGGTSTDSGNATAAAGPSSGSSCQRSKEKTIAEDYPYTNLPLYSTLKKFASAEAKTRGYKLIWTADNLQLDKQMTNLRSLVAQKVPAILTLPLEPTAAEPVAAQAMANCTVIVSYAAQLKHEDSSLGLSNVKTGADLAANAVAWAKKQSFPVKALVLTNNGSEAAKQRINGVLDGLKKAPSGKIDVVSKQDATSPQGAQSAAQQILQAHPEINMILGFDDDWALGGLQAWRNLGRSASDPKLYVGGMDGANDALQELQKHNAYRCTIGYDVGQIGKLMVDIPADILEGKKVAPVVNAKLYTLTSGDPLVAKFLKASS